MRVLNERRRTFFPSQYARQSRERVVSAVGLKLKKFQCFHKYKYVLWGLSQYNFSHCWGIMYIERQMNFDSFRGMFSAFNFRFWDEVSIKNKKY